MISTVPHTDLDSVFLRARQESRGVLIPYLTAGYPDPAGYVDLSVAILEAGADALEIGVPFSDPLLDGPAIQHSQQLALNAGITPADCLRFAAEIHARSDKPLLLMGAFNPILSYGLQVFCQAAATAGVSALIVPDLPCEEQAELAGHAEKSGLHFIQLVAPTSSDERIAQICATASGFVYCISVAGVTGARGSVAATARPLVDRVRRCTGKPVAVGFGISSAMSAHEIVQFADGVIVGSALIRLVGETAPAERVARARGFITDLCSAMRRVAPDESPAG